MSIAQETPQPWHHYLFRVVLLAGLAGLGVMLLAVLAFAAHNNSARSGAMVFAFVFAAVVSSLIRMALYAYFLGVYAYFLAVEFSGQGRRSC